MAQFEFSGSSSSVQTDLAVDLGPFLNTTLRGLWNCGTVAAAKAAGGETYSVLSRGTVGGDYAGMEYGIEKILGTRDWKNAMIAGALTGALVSAVRNNNREKIVMDAIAGGAIATAAEFFNHLD